jgi:hypothetical protein
MPERPQWGRNAVENADVRSTGKSLEIAFNPKTKIKRLSDGHFVLNGSHFSSAGAMLEAVAFAAQKLENASRRQTV